jgi:hypothetical protein
MPEGLGPSPEEIDEQEPKYQLVLTESELMLIHSAITDSSLPNKVELNNLRKKLSPDNLPYPLQQTPIKGPGLHLPSREAIKDNLMSTRKRVSNEMISGKRRAIYNKEADKYLTDEEREQGNHRIRKEPFDSLRNLPKGYKIKYPGENILWDHRLHHGAADDNTYKGEYYWFGPFIIYNRDGVEVATVHEPKGNNKPYLEFGNEKYELDSIYAEDAKKKIPELVEKYLPDQE